jgi:Leucine-rich repeat (LRR) protein/ankyrin repeat protein
VDIVEYLLEQGSVAMASPITDMTALHLASSGGHGDVVVCLLNKLPALLMIDDSAKETSLHIAARMGHVEIVKNLLTVAACTERLKNRSISTSDESGELERSFLCGESLRVPMNEALPEMIIDIMAITLNEQKTALHEAAITGNVEIVKLLVDFMREYLTHETVTSRTATFNGPIVGGFSPLQSEGASTPTLRSSGFPTKNSPSSRKAYAVPGIDLMTLKGRTAFHEAAKQGHFDVMKILLQAGADINAFMRPSLDAFVNVELTALVQACLMQRLDVIKFLLQNGATDARLKALSRSLKIPYNEAAGLLLCYNGCLNEIIDVRKPTPEMFGSQPIANLNVSWNSKNLTYVCKEWLELAITEFPNPNDKYCVISELDISSNNLTSLPIEIFSLPYLKQLDFNRNKVTQFPLVPEKPCGGWSCPRLNTIDAANNQLSAIPSCLFHLPELRELLATGNKISDVPACVWTAPKLQRLYLSKNFLETFPTTYEEGANGCVPALFASTSEGSPMSPYSVTSPDTISNLDSGYRSHPTAELIDSISVKYNSPKFAFPKPGTPLKSHRSLEIKSNTIQTQSVISRRLENFQDDNIEVDELEDTESTAEDGSSRKSFMLETLDLSHNKLTTLPTGLSCLAPRLTKLNISHNQIKSLGTVSDFPLELEYLEASSNELHTAIAPPLAGADLRYYQPCARKVLGLAANGLTSSVNSSDTPKSFLYKPCNHRIHKNLRKLSTVKFNKNFLVDLQLFRMPVRSGSRGEFGTSVEETMRTKRTGTIGAEAIASNILPRLNEVSGGKNSSLGERRSQTIGRKVELVKKNSNEVSPSHPGDKKSSKESSGDPDKAASLGSSNSSQDEQSSSPSVVASPLFPQLTTLELANNRLKNVPANIHLIANLSTLSISHNTEIDTLPLELSNLDHLWSLEYEGCPLTNPPYQDLDKFRLASDKLLYMRSLLHE